jgi:leader peptidase (prepilin peptidase)/N-methyltransferase
VVAERVPAGVSINGRSRCACGRQLKARENIPVLGWLAARGVARCCGARLPRRLLGWEVGYAAWGALVALAATRAGTPPGLGLAVVAAVLFLAPFAAVTAPAWRPGGKVAR